MVFLENNASILFEILNLVVSISGFDSLKLESVTIPTSFPWDTISKVSKYYQDAFKLVCPNAEIVLGSKLYEEKTEYWSELVKFTKHMSIARTMRTLTIMGRSEDDNKIDVAKLLYPAMQAVDIHSEDRLDEIFKLQKGLSEIMKLDRYPKDAESRVSALCTAIMHEAVELQRTTNWKWWKTPTEFNQNEARKLLEILKN